MQNIPLALAKAGMTLARDVFRGDSPVGIPICGRGTELTVALIARFENMGIQSVYVAGCLDREERERIRDQLLTDMDCRFSKTIQAPLNTILHKIYKEYLTKSMGECDASPPE
jgi:hypothetical protein